MNELEQLIAIYQKAQQRLLELAVNTKGKGTAHYYKRLGADVNNIILDLKVASRRYAGTNIPKEYFYGVKKAVDGLKALGIHLGGTYAFAKVHQSAVKVLVDNLIDNLDEALNTVGRRINDAFRKAQLEQIIEKQTTGQTVKRASASLKEKIEDQGIGAFTDTMGRVWQMDRYCEMVVRSVTREATNTGLLTQLQLLGYDLVKMSSHRSPCPICAPLEGRVYSITGKTEGYPKLDKAFGEYANVHPNCKHVLVPYIPELDPNADKVKAFSNRSFSDDPRSAEEKKAYEQAQKRKAKIRATKKQWEQYKARLGDKVPSLSTFRKLKERDDAKYKELQKLFREAGKE